MSRIPGWSQGMSTSRWTLKEQKFFQPVSMQLEPSVIRVIILPVDFLLPCLICGGYRYLVGNFDQVPDSLVLTDNLWRTFLRKMQSVMKIPESCWSFLKKQPIPSVLKLDLGLWLELTRRWKGWILPAIMVDGPTYTNRNATFKFYRIHHTFTTPSPHIHHINAPRPS